VPPGAPKFQILSVSIPVDYYRLLSVSVTHTFIWQAAEAYEHSDFCTHK